MKKTILDFGCLSLTIFFGLLASAPACLAASTVVGWGSNYYFQLLIPPELTNAVMVAGGGGHSLALRADGMVVAWGNNNGGQADVPASATNVVMIAAGLVHSLALRSDGTVIAWGYNDYGQTMVPTTLSNVVAIAAGDLHSLALRADGKLVAWGASYIGQTYVPPYLTKVVAIGAGANHNLAVRDDGTVVALGNGTYGQTNVPANATNVIAVAGGSQSSLALRANGTVLSWGTNSPLTDMTNVIAGLTNATAIAAGNNHYAALRADGTILTWGYYFYGQTNLPTGVTDAVAVAAGGAHTLALLGDGGPIITRQPVGGTIGTGREFTLQANVTGMAPLTCQWQFNGLDIPNATNTTLVLSNLALTDTGYYQLIASNALNVAASVPAQLTVLSNNTLSFWTLPAAETNYYQGGKVILGASVTGNGPLTWQWFSSATNKNYSAIPGATNDTLTYDPALAVQSGYYYLAVSNQFGGITSAPVIVRVLFARAWGYSAVNIPPVNVTNAIAIATGGDTSSYGYGHYFALGADGKLKSWANYNPYNGETSVSALSNSFVTAIAANLYQSLALRSDGTVYAWGDGPTNPPSGLSGVTAISCGGNHDLALKYDGTIAGWGNNLYGQATNNSAATNVVAIAPGFQHSLVLRADGTMVGWGAGYYPGTIPADATNVIAIAAGQNHDLALRANGTVVGWGSISIPAGLSNIVAVSASGNHSALLRNDGTVLMLGTENGYAASNLIPADVANVIAISSGGDHDFALLGTRAPAFTIQPVSRSVFKGTTNVLLAAKVSGVQPVTYQWRFNGANIAGATNDTLLRTNLQFAHAGTYQLIASNAYGVVASKPAKLVVTLPLGEALDTTNRVWTTSGYAQWFGQTNVTHDGVDAARTGEIGGNQETILQTTVATNRAGYYFFWWKVSSEEYFDVLEFRVNGITQASISGEVDWQPCAIAIGAGTNTLQWRYTKDATFSTGQDGGWVDGFLFVAYPRIYGQPASRTNYAGTSATFSVDAYFPVLDYRWQKDGFDLNDGGNVSGATTSYLTLTNVQDADVASYTVVITNLAGSVTSSPALLTVLDSPPIITTQPASRTNYAGSTATFSVSAVGAVPLSYQWQKDGTDLTNGGNVSGTTTRSLTLTNVQDADAAGYSVVITNVYGSLTSSPALLTVIDSPGITTPPVSCTNLAGTTATFSVTAYGRAPLSFQWSFNGINLDGATNSLLTLENVRPVNAGPYQVVVTNAWGSATGSAILTVVRSRVVAWGSNLNSQTNVPPGLANVVAVNGGEQHSLALQSNGTVVAWGYNYYGQANVPVGLGRVVAIDGGSYHSLALQANGTVAAWGQSNYGQISVPPDLTNAVAIAGGYIHSLALRSNGTVVAWGDNVSGQTNVPTGLSNVAMIAAGYYHNLALGSNGTAVAWGYNYYGQTNVPPGLSNVVAVAAGVRHSLALQSDGTVVAWGDNYYGQTNVPPGLTNAVAIAGGNYHSLALQADGTMVIWGYNDSGQLTVPADLTNVVAIASGGYHNLAIQNDGSPFILRHPASQTTASNTTVSFNATALGQSPLNYQWRKNGVNLADGDNVSGSSTATLTLSNVQSADMAAYTVVITNAIDRVTGSPALLIVVGPPVFALQPAGQTVNMGTHVQFTATALGSPAPVYQWWQNGTNPVGLNSANLILLSVGRAQNGVYTVQVTNTWGSLLSSNATLKVLVPQKLGVPGLLPDGTLQLISGDADGGLLSASDLAYFEARASTNLTDWVTLPGALSLTNGMLLLQDNATTNWPQRFYRIIEHP